MRIRTEEDMVRPDIACKCNFYDIDVRFAERDPHAEIEGAFVVRTSADVTLVPDAFGERTLRGNVTLFDCMWAKNAVLEELERQGRIFDWDAGELEQSVAESLVDEAKSPNSLLTAWAGAHVPAVERMPAFETLGEALAYAKGLPLEETVHAQGFTGQMRYLHTVCFDLLPGDGPRIEPTPILQIAA